MSTVHAFVLNSLIQLNSLFIYVLSSTANGQLQSQHEYKQQQQDNTGQNIEQKKQQRQRKLDQLGLFTLKYDLLKISVDLQTAFAADTHLAEGATERGKVTYVTSRNTNADCFQDRGTIITSVTQN
jgi:hypothetical protein